MKKFILSFAAGIVLAAPLPVIAASTAPATAATGLNCCSSSNTSCFCGNADCCTTNCQKVKDSGSGCLLINCANQCAAKYPDIAPISPSGN